jgi:hypothetical protein
MFGLDYAAAATVCGEHAEPTPHTVLLKNEGWSTGTKEQETAVVFGVTILRFVKGAD